MVCYVSLWMVGSWLTQNWTGLYTILQILHTGYCRFSCLTK
jgi:hypothetical protein